MILLLAALALADTGTTDEPPPVESEQPTSPAAPVAPAEPAPPPASVQSELDALRQALEQAATTPPPDEHP